MPQLSVEFTMSTAIFKPLFFFFIIIHFCWLRQPRIFHSPITCRLFQNVRDFSLFFLTWDLSYIVLFSLKIRNTNSSITILFTTRIFCFFWCISVSICSLAVEYFYLFNKVTFYRRPGQERQQQKIQTHLQTEKQRGHRIKKKKLQAKETHKKHPVKNLKKTLTDTYGCSGVTISAGI